MIAVKRPFLVIVSFLVLGIFLGRGTENVALTVVAAVALAAAVGVLALRRGLRRRYMVFVCILPLLSLLGFGLIHNSFAVNNNYLEAAAVSGEVIELAGRVTDASFGQSDWAWVTLATNHNGGGRVNVRVVLDADERPALGQNIVVTGVVRYLDFPRNPGSYNEEQHLRSRKIEYGMFAEEVELGGVSLDPVLLIRGFRFRAVDIIERIYPQPVAGIVTALIVGTSSTIEPEVRDIYRAAGVYHILAVSGSHVVMVAAFSFWVSLMFKVSERNAGIITLCVLAVYTVFTGAGPATVRSVIMCAVVITGKIFNRDSDTLNSASFAAFLLLLYEPLLLWDVGVIYSFSAVIALFKLTPVIESVFDKLNWRGKVVKKYTCGCIAAWLATLPITAYFFFQVSPVAVVVNILLVPTVSVAVLAGFLSVFAGLFSVTAASLFAGVAYVLISVYEAVCTFALRLPFAVIATGRPPLYVIVAYALFLIAAAYLHKAKVPRKFKVAAYAAMPAVVLFLAVFHLVSPQPPKIYFLDVGQGDAAVLTMNRRAVVIDGGGRMLREIGANTGVRVLMPFLDYKGINVVDAAFLSHPHEDHSMGLVELMLAGRLNTLFIADVEHLQTQPFRDVLQAAELSGTQIILISAGYVFEFKDFTIEKLFPQQGYAAAVNDQSQVKRVTVNGLSILFTGDIERQGERDLLAFARNYGICLNADILKVPHHASRTSSSAQLLYAVSPRLAMAGVGRRNPHGHPHPSVVQRYKYMGIPLLTTAEEGAIIITPNADGGSYTTMRMRYR